MSEEAPSREQLSKYAQQQWEVRPPLFPAKASVLQHASLCWRSCLVVTGIAALP